MVCKDATVPQTDHSYRIIRVQAFAFARLLHTVVASFATGHGFDMFRLCVESSNLRMQYEHVLAGIPNDPDAIGLGWIGIISKERARSEYCR